MSDALLQSEGSPESLSAALATQNDASSPSAGMQVRLAVYFRLAVSSHALPIYGLEYSFLLESNAEPMLSQMCPLEPQSVATSMLADGFLTTPQSTLHIPISPLGNWEKWPDSKSPGSSLSAAKATGPNAFPPPKD